jgi:hypothetical protein
LKIESVFHFHKIDAGRNLECRNQEYRMRLEPSKNSNRRKAKIEIRRPQINYTFQQNMPFGMEILLENRRWIQNEVWWWFREDEKIYEGRVKRRRKWATEIGSCKKIHQRSAKLTGEVEVFNSGSLEKSRT